MTTTTTTDEPRRFTGDRYERMKQAVELLASDQNIAAAPFPYDSEGMRAFTTTIASDRLLDDLTDHDADRVAMYSLLDFCRGAEHMAWRLSDLLSKEPTCNYKHDRELAVVCASARIFSMLLAEFLRGGIDLPADEIDGRSAR